MSAQHLPAVNHALTVHADHADWGREKLVNEARALAEWGVFSNTHIAAFTGLRIGIVNGITDKSDHTGGTLRPEALSKVIEVIRMSVQSERTPSVAVSALRSGVSSIMLARLTGLPQTTISRWHRQAVARDSDR